MRNTLTPFFANTQKELLTDVFILSNDIIEYSPNNLFEINVGII